MVKMKQKITPTNEEYKESKLETAKIIEKKTKADDKNFLDVELIMNKVDIDATKDFFAKNDTEISKG